MEYLVNLFFLFLTYSIIGWCIEVVLKYIEFHRFINRGFLTGPVCPIYGTGAVLITVVVGGLSRLESGIGTTFALSYLLCGLLEYLTSYVMEKRFHARWWDYSRKPMNLHGRIWIGNLVLFGLGGVLIIHVVNPPLYRLLATAPLGIRAIAAGFLAAVLIADFTLSHFVLKLVKLGVERSEADNTEGIRKEIDLLLSDRSYFYKRFADAYPDVIYRTERINARLAEVKAETERLRREAEQRFEERKEQVAASLEPATMIKSTIIAKQEELIALLYDSETASGEMKALKAEIEREKERLDNRPLNRIITGIMD